MNVALIAADLRHFEGCRLVAYQDTGGVWTIGDGHTGPEVVEGLVWTQAEADAALAADLAAHVAQLDADPRTGPWWRTLCDVRQDALVELSFNMGEGDLDQFVLTLSDLRNGDDAAAGVELLDSEWAGQVHPARADYVSAMLTNGVRPPLP